MPRLSEGTLAQWGAGLDTTGNLAIGGAGVIELAGRFGTPLHVVNYERLLLHAASFASQFQSRYAGKVEVYFAAKSNPVAGIIEAVMTAGLGVEVFTPFELRLARLAGCPASRIIVNGPAKTRDFLSECIGAGVHLIVADSLREVEQMIDLARKRDTSVDILLRANVDYVPRGMNRGSATASRGSVFGMTREELVQAAHICSHDSLVRFRGLHTHIGSGIRHASAYRDACRILCRIALELRDKTGAAIDYLDIGGGFGTPMVREFSDLEFLLYHGLNRAPAPPAPEEAPAFGAFAEMIAEPVTRAFGDRSLPLPTLVLEPGRCLVSSNQLLLLRVLAVKRKSGHRDYVVTDGGQMPVNFPTFYEYHALLCCREPFRAPAPAVDVIGRGCHSADYVLRNAALPPVEEGDVLAVMDSGAYFLSFEGNFGFPRSAVVAVGNGTASLLRRAETYEDMLSREQIDAAGQPENPKEALRHDPAR
ncbi:MAG: diaminopimelate decarboxylase family protein [Bryobacteraceae bacterium]